MHRPPPLLLAAYRLLGWRLGPSHQAWVYADLTRPGFTLRSATPAAVAFGAVLAAAFAVTGSDPWRALPPAAALVLLAFLLRGSLQARALRQQGLSPDGQAAASWFADDPGRRRRNAIGAVTTVLLVGAGAVLLAVRSQR